MWGEADSKPFPVRETFLTLRHSLAQGPDMQLLLDVVLTGLAQGKTNHRHARPDVRQFCEAS